MSTSQRLVYLALYIEVLALLSVTFFLSYGNYSTNYLSFIVGLIGD